jgi:transcriptional regulator with PAS, ATPase and Fis domain
MRITADPPFVFTVERIIRAEDLPIPTAAESQRAKNPAASNQNLNLHVVILDHVLFVLRLNRGNKLRAANQLGISRSTLYRILGRDSIRSLSTAQPAPSLLRSRDI